MEALACGGVLHYGTHNGSRIGMHAARASLRKLTENNCAAFAHTWRIADRLCGGLTDLFRRKRIPAIVQRLGPMFQIMFTERPAISDYREFCQHVDRKAYQQFIFKLFELGVYTTPAATLHSIVTFAHKDEDVELTLTAAEKALDAGTCFPIRK
jgi:glutamate-1-semialdehyde 2,1-aminomutase